MHLAKAELGLIQSADQLEAQQQNEGPGGMVLISGPPGGGKTEWVLQHLRDRGLTRIIWVSPEVDLYPVALEEMGFDLSQILCVTPPLARWVWVIEQSVSSRVAPVVVMDASSGGKSAAKWVSEVQLRRLQLLSQKNQIFLVWILEEGDQVVKWPFSFQQKVWRDPLLGERCSEKILKGSRHGKL